ncbi:aspartyl protease family protein [Candidatus Berkiella cookevillensis]|uniref:Aspartyl protease family protein n=1 Tax=Candidatus Berkiella cookevillensis TaxID=437022 RepID=A0A0Q9YJA7_9GAMM|nr:pepsin/retropepsin-like aspartic protease family protein [Candidatus Berkiella cookevillensis]MCS5707956.1 aspartyl protease family protein [Candidatus Berkiella cookevillensis]
MYLKNQFYLCIFIFSSFSPAVNAQAQDAQIINLNISHYIPLITGQIEEKEIKLLFDTGSNAPLILNDKILQNLNTVTKTGRTRKSIDSSGKITSTDEVIIPKLTLSSMTIPCINTYSYQPWGLKFSPDKTTNTKEEGLIADNFHEQQDGIIGINLFSNKKIIIDYSNQRIIIFDHDAIPSPYNKKKWQKMSYQSSSESLVISGKINNLKAATFLLDTGATASILKPTILGNIDQNLVSLNFNNFKLEDHFFHNIEFQEPQVDGILGYNFFNTTLVLIDLVNQNIFLAGL